MPRAFAATAAALLLATACGGGGDRAAVSPTDGSPVPTRPSSAPETTLLPVSPTPSPSSVAKHGSARVTYRGQTTSWAERNCESTRGLDGEVVGWMATFQDVTEQTKRYVMGASDSKSFVQVRLRGGYTGDGTYPSERLALRYADERGNPVGGSGFGAAGQTLVLRDGGKSGTFRGKDVAFEFTCDPADDTSTETRDAVPETPAPGTAYAVLPEGAVFTFPEVRCGTEGGDTSVLAGSYPHFFRLRTGVTSGGGAGQVLFGVHGVVVRFDPAGTRADVTAESGRFRYSPDGPNAVTDVTRGAYAC